MNINPINVENLPAIQATFDPANQLVFIDLTNVADKDIDWENI